MTAAGGGEHGLDLPAVRADVEALAAMPRRSASAGERASAELVAARLRTVGVGDIRVDHFRYQHTFAGAHAAHFGAGLAAAAIGGRRGAVLAATALAFYDREVSGRRQWVRRLLPAGRGANVIGRVPARHERRRTVVLVAHHDAAQTGLMWHPLLARVAAARARRQGRVDSFAAAPAAALGAVTVGCLLGRRGLCAAAGAVLAAAMALMADVARGATVPGASDNATGVAGLIALGGRFAAAPLATTEVAVVATGCEESGMGGMAAWLRGGGRDLDPATTLVLGLDTLGAGEPVVLSGEALVRTVHYPPQGPRWVDRGAERAALEPPRRWVTGGWTDPVLAVHAGLPAASIVSIRDGGFPHYHLPTDRPVNVDWVSVERAIRLAAGATEAFAEG